MEKTSVRIHKSTQKKICYILPAYKEETDSHFAYLYDFLELLSRSAPLFLIVEKGVPSRERFSRAQRLFRIRSGFFLVRIIEECVALFVSRLSGCRVFYIHYSYTGALLASFMTRIFGGKVYYWNCGMPWLYGAQKPLRRVLSAVDFLVTGTKTMKEMYAQTYGLPLEKILVLPNWIDVKKFVPSASVPQLREKLHVPADRPIVLFVHRLSERKGADRILALARRMKTNRAYFFIVGDGPLAEKLRDEARLLGLENDVRFCGGVPQKDIADYFYASDVFIMPSREEGFPHVLLEAMAAGIPFVATRVGGVRDIIPIPLQRYVVKDGDMEGFALRLAELLKNEMSRHEAGRIGKEHIRKYDLPAVVQQFLDVLVP